MIRVGTSGWSHPDWVGPFYPVALRDRPSEWFGHYATRFCAVEIHSTFDAFPSEALVEEWARQGVTLQESPATRGFEYSLKLPRLVTHEALPGGDADAAREITGRFDREVLDPLAGEGLLGTVVVQMPPGFTPTPSRVEMLLQVMDALAERRVALEFRDPAWFSQGCVIPLAEPLFASAWVTLVEQDSPVVPAAQPPVVARHVYMRLHGRRADLWPHTARSASRSHAEAPQRDGARYDYLYAAEELTPFAERAALLSAAGKDVRVVFNNTPGAKAAANGLDFLRMVGDAPDVPRPKLTEQTKLAL